MAHVSRLSQSLARRDLTCIVCGCTEDNACQTPEGPCRWVAPGLCSNPRCLAQFTVDQVGPMLRDPGDEQPDDLDDALFELEEEDEHEGILLPD